MDFQSVATFCLASFFVGNAFHWCLVRAELKHDARQIAQLRNCGHQLTEALMEVTAERDLAERQLADERAENERTKSQRLAALARANAANAAKRVGAA